MKKSGYYADMTRTVVKGEPSREIREMYDALREAKQLGISRVKSGGAGPGRPPGRCRLFRGAGI